MTNFKLSSLVLVLIFVGCKTTQATTQDLDIGVFLTVSADASVGFFNRKITERLLVLNWYGKDADHQDDKVALYDKDPSGNISDYQTLAQVYPARSRGNHFKTDVSFPHQTFEVKDTNLSRCLGFWIVYLRNEKQIKLNCLRSRPNWMRNLRNEIGEHQLRRLMIPGTHDSGAYAKYTQFSGHNVITKLSITQDTSVWNQLVYGIRYLDLRVGYYGRNNFWINHDYFKTDTRLDTVLDDVKRFLESTEEIVILDFHRFPVGFKKNVTRFRELANFIKDRIGHLMFPTEYGYAVPLNYIWNSGKRLLVTFNTRLRTVDRKNLWSGVVHLWGDANKIKDLENYFAKQMNKRASWKFWSAMGHLTTNPLKFILQPYKDIRYMADEVNTKVTGWFRDRWWNKTNIVSTDYFLGNNLIEVCIDSNLKRVLSN
ncbi:METTL6 (predicted) [Pycnogonum litorale]